MKPPSGVPLVRDYLRIIVGGWLVILCATVLSGAAGWLAWYAGTPVYQSTAKLFVITPGNATTIDAYYGQLNAALRAPSYVQLAHSKQVTARTIEQLELTETPDSLAARISALPVTSVLLDVSVVGTDREQTRETADVVADNMVGLTRQLATVESGDTELAKVGEAGPAQRVDSMWANVGEAAAVGFGLSVLLVIAHGLLRDRLLARRQVDRLIDETVNGHSG